MHIAFRFKETVQKENVHCLKINQLLQSVVNTNHYLPSSKLYKQHDKKYGLQDIQKTQ